MFDASRSNACSLTAGGAVARIVRVDGVALNLDSRRVTVEDRRGDALGDPLAGEADLLVQQRGLAVRDVAIRQADTQDSRWRDAGLAQGLPDGRAEAARQHALLDGHQQ